MKVENIMRNYMLAKYPSIFRGSMRNYMLTKYPSIFRGSWWGEYKDANTEIVLARNKFVEDLEIIKRSRKTPQYIQKLYCDDYRRKLGMDHIEVYENKNEYIIISSPYGPVIDILYEGWIEIDKLYSSDSRTFLTLSNKRKFNDKRKCVDN
jgi:hypothetical protein